MVSKSRTFSCLPFSLRNFKHTTNTESRKENNPQETPSFKHQQHAAMMEASLPPATSTSSPWAVPKSAPDGSHSYSNTSLVRSSECIRSSDIPNLAVQSFASVCSVTESRLTLSPVAHQAPLSTGFSRQEYWSRLPFPPSGALPNPGIAQMSLHWKVESLPLYPPGKPTFSPLPSII